MYVYSVQALAVSVTDGRCSAGIADGALFLDSGFLMWYELPSASYNVALRRSVCLRKQLG